MVRGLLDDENASSLEVAVVGGLSRVVWLLPSNFR